MTHEVFHLYCLQINRTQSLNSNTVNSDAVIVRDFIIYSELKLRAFPYSSFIVLIVLVVLLTKIDCADKSWNCFSI